MPLFGFHEPHQKGKLDWTLPQCIAIDTTFDLTREERMSLEEWHPHSPRQVIVTPRDVGGRECRLWIGCRAGRASPHQLAQNSALGQMDKLPSTYSIGQDACEALIIHFTLNLIHTCLV